MNDELKEKIMEFLRRDLDELLKNRVRIIAMVVFVLVALIYTWEPEGKNGEEIDLSDTPPVTKDLPVQKLPDKKIPAQIPETIDGVKIVPGANSEQLFIGDPFAGVEKPKPPPPKQVEPQKTELPKIPPPSQIPQPPPKVEPKEKIILTGTAISGDNKTAMFLRGNQTEFLTVGDEIGGRIISDITPESVTFTDGGRVNLQKELN
ncbi:MAG: hypothetical protein IKN27_10135 [Selenomonadaceae bacterium]|nr:hypothetical protein [Selenomonadaceae bacterium]